MSTQLGKSIALRLNLFHLEQYPIDGIVYQYDLEIRNRNHSVIPRLYRRRVFQQWVKENFNEDLRKSIAFDNKTIVLSYNRPLSNIDSNGVSQTIRSVDSRHRIIEYHLTIKQVGNPIDLSVENALNQQNVRQILSIAANEFCSSRSDFIYNRLFFQSPTSKDRGSTWDLGLGSAAWRGFYSCLMFPHGQCKMLMNLDVRYGVFTKDQSFIDFLIDLIKESPTGKRNFNRSQVTINDFDRRNLDFFLRHCKNRRVRSDVGANPIRYVIEDFGASASEQTFRWSKKNDKEISVENYYREQYGIQLQFPWLPTLVVKKSSFLPMELMHVESVRQTKYTEEQAAKLCRLATLTPVQYRREIQLIRDDVDKQNFDENPFIRMWNIRVKNTMIDINGRILPRPKILIGRNVEFYQPAAFPSVWALINLTSTWKMDQCKDFYNQLRRIASTKGINCPAPVIYEEFSAKVACEAITEMYERNLDCQFLFVLLPEEKRIRDEVYRKIKTLCEGEDGLGLVSQMSDISKLKRHGNTVWNDSTISNLLQKINPKLNGINSIVEFSDHSRLFFDQAKKIMYVGIDLSHWIRSDGIKCSTVAVVASADHIPNRFFKEIFYQERPPDQRGKSIESIVNLKEMFKSLIEKYYQSSGCPPSAIIVYRDGYSVSEFQTIFAEELQAIREACVESASVYRPCLTYIVVVKRHAIRAFDENSPEKNPPGGTIFDSPDILTTNHDSFYLISHDGMKGTSRPTYYHVLYDDNQLPRDQLRMITYALCFTCARSPKSTSIPSPVKYADLLAYRARLYLHSVANVPIGRIPLSSKLEPDRLFFL